MPHKHFGRCPACNNVGPLTRHHVMPVRFWGKGNHNEHIVLLCAQCHRDLETNIPHKEQLPVWHYFAIVAKFIKERGHAS